MPRILCSTIVWLSLFALHCHGFRQTYAKDSSEYKMDRLVCYLRAGAEFRQAPATFTPSDADFFKCTHVIYSYLKVQDGRIRNRFENDEEMIVRWREAVYRSRPDDVVFLLAIGSWAEEWEEEALEFDKIVRHLHARNQFAEYITGYLLKRGVHGLSLEWKHIGQEGRPESDKENFVKLVQDLRNAFHAYSARRNLKKTLILHVVMSPFRDIIKRGYDIPRLLPNLGFLTVAAYDIHGPWETQTGHHAPLYIGISPIEVDAKLTVDWVVQYYLRKGVPREKLTLAISTQGRTFTLANNQSTKVGAPVIGPGNKFPYSNSPGTVLFLEICYCLKAESPWLKYSRDERMSYVVMGDQWITIDDTVSVTDKVCYAKQHGLGGIAFRYLSDDDFNGALCNSSNSRRYPLLWAIYTEFRSVGKECPAQERESNDSYTGNDESGNIPSTHSSSCQVVIELGLMFVLYTIILVEEVF